MVVTSEALGILLGGSCSPALPFNTPLDRASIPPEAMVHPPRWPDWSSNFCIIMHLKCRADR